MFKRLVVEEWQGVMQMIGFAFFFTVFITATFRAMRTPKAQLKHLESLPLENDEHTDQSAQ
jgi:uncharacterized membrane protein YiaA